MKKKNNVINHRNSSYYSCQKILVTFCFCFISLVTEVTEILTDSSIPLCLQIWLTTQKPKFRNLPCGVCYDDSMIQESLYTDLGTVVWWEQICSQGTIHPQRCRHRVRLWPLVKGTEKDLLTQPSRRRPYLEPYSLQEEWEGGQTSSSPRLVDSEISLWDLSFQLKVQSWQGEQGVLETEK